jgi:CubicO group peptidase (beta-lactamase class C family)
MAATALSSNVARVLDIALLQQRIVGAVVMVAHDGETVCQHAVGFADRESGRPMTDDTLFRLASIAKPIVSAAVMSLIARGQLALDDAIDQWLPEFQPRLASGIAPKITVRHLLTHTAGLGYALQEPADGPYHRANVSDGLDQPGLSLEENLRRIASAPLHREPGTGWQYSIAIDVLGAVVERICGQSLATVVEELVTRPLSMQDSAFHVVDAGRLAVAYVNDPPLRPMADPETLPFGFGAGIVFSPSRVFNAQSFPSGGAGMVGSASDILKFLECIRRGGQPILPQHLAAAMMENQIGGLSVAMMPGCGFGFGGAVLLDPAEAQTPQCLGSWMWGGVYGHSWYVDPVARLTVVLLTNTALEGMIGLLPFQLREAVYGPLRGVI